LKYLSQKLSKKIFHCQRIVDEQTKKERTKAALLNSIQNINKIPMALLATTSTLPNIWPD